MKVIAFKPRPCQQDGSWRTCELNQLAGSFAASVARGEASGWETGTTEIGDPQFYLLGASPDDECILCVSRLGRIYVLEDGGGRVLLEGASLEWLAAEAIAFLKKKRTRMMARALPLWLALRHAFEEKIEPMLVEGEELLTHFAPQFAAIA
jgi:hypothetical protein